MRFVCFFTSCYCLCFLLSTIFFLSCFSFLMSTILVSGDIRNIFKTSFRKTVNSMLIFSFSLVPYDAKHYNYLSNHSSPFD